MKKVEAALIARVDKKGALFLFSAYIDSLKAFKDMKDNPFLSQAGYSVYSIHIDDEVIRE